MRKKHVRLKLKGRHSYKEEMNVSLKKKLTLKRAMLLIRFK